MPVARTVNWEAATGGLLSWSAILRRLEEIKASKISKKWTEGASGSIQWQPSWSLEAWETEGAATPQTWDSIVYSALRSFVGCHLWNYPSSLTIPGVLTEHIYEKKNQSLGIMQTLRVLKQTPGLPQWFARPAVSTTALPQVRDHDAFLELRMKVKLSLFDSLPHCVTNSLHIRTSTLGRRGGSNSSLKQDIHWSWEILTHAFAHLHFDTL